MTVTMNSPPHRDKLPRWDLSELYPSPASPQFSDELEEAQREAARFQATYKDRIASLEAANLKEAIRGLEAIEQRVARAQAYAQLLHAIRSTDPETGAALVQTQEQATRIHTQLLFFELEWLALDTAHVDRLLVDPELAQYRHFLAVIRKYRPYRLSESEERILAEKRLTARTAWNRLFDETLTRARFEVDGVPLGQEEVLTRLKSEDRSLRRQAAAAFTTGLEAHLPLLTHIFNTVISDKFIEDRLRGYPHWLTERNLANEASDEMVTALIGRVTARYDLVQRYYRLKGQLLQIDPLYDYDRYAPLPGGQREVDWATARELVLTSFGDFSSEMHAIATKFFEQGWIDAPVVEGKQSGAFSHPVTPDHHPYILVNFTGTVSDVMTLAHELGHGVHQYLAASQGHINASTPLTTAETASVFSEMLVFEHLLNIEPDAYKRLALLTNKLEEIFATTFRQVAMNRFEEAIHTARRSEGELSAERISELWMQTQRPMFEDAVLLREEYRHWWCYIPHFLHVPGYVYAYAFGELLTLALYERYRQEGPEFVPRYLDLLRAGGSAPPEELLASLGVTLSDPHFWDQGLSRLESMVVQAEELAEQAAPYPG